jgi:hypothetical protein
MFSPFSFKNLAIKPIFSELGHGSGDKEYFARLDKALV